PKITKYPSKCHKPRRHYNHANATIFRSRHFEAIDRSCNKSNKFHQCRLCLAAARPALRVGASSVLVEDIRARKENFEAHLEDCRHGPSWAKPSSQEFRPYSRHDDERELSSLPPGEQSQIPDYFSQRFDPGMTEELERLLVEFQADNRLPDLFISRPSTRNLFAFLNALSVASSPSRQVLGGRIIDRCAKTAFEDDKSIIRRAQFLTEAKVNFLSDVWMNIARMHLLGCQISLYGAVCAIGLFPTSDRHDGVAIAEHMEKVMLQLESNGWSIGAVVTDDAGQCARARRILALRWPKVIFLRCFAHSINNLVKGVLQTTFRDVAAQASAVVNCLNGSSSKWLVRAKKQWWRRMGRKGIGAFCSV
ncbi:hypothetical protein L917_12128, partial [Phytophthora nicotianae]